MKTRECARCGAEFDLTSDHTEIVRRDFAGDHHPPKVEHLCGHCRRAYVSFLESRE